MNSKIEPVLEKYVNDDEKKEITESTHILTTPQQEVVKPKPNPVIIEQQKKIMENQEILNKESKEFRFSQKMKEEGKIRGSKKRHSSFFPPSLISSFFEILSMSIKQNLIKNLLTIFQCTFDI